jgi:alpha-galactosidase/6-phospho-beta-glucosidase family protein
MRRSGHRKVATVSDVRISLIGAGSAVFSLVLIRDIAVTEGLSGCEVVLMDRDEGRLKAANALTTKYAQKLNPTVKVSMTTSREAALKDADFVVNTALAGGHYEQETMRSVGEAHGYYRGLDAVEFNMVSDYLPIQGYNQLRLILDIAEDVHHLAPDAWFLNVANPMFEATTMVHRLTKVKKFAGFCDGPADMDELEAALGLEVGSTEWSMAGFNHNIFLTELTHGGEDAYPLVDEWMEKKAEKFWASFSTDFDFQMSRVGGDMYRRYGLYPIGDTVRSGTWKYHYDLATKKRWYGPNGGYDSEEGWNFWLRRLEQRTKTVFALADKPADEIVKEFPPQPSEDQMVPFIDAVTNDDEKRMVINVPNAGIIGGLPQDETVEVPCRVDRKGIRPEKVRQLPKTLVEFVLKPRLQRLEWVYDAFVSGSRDSLLDIVYRDPRTKSDEQAKDAVDAILSLPFNSEMKDHYR